MGNLTVFEDLISYADDTMDEGDSFGSLVADYFDLPNRYIPLTKEEKKFIKKNMAEST